jgi:PIN domain nuclease of toxin-antitoxin system
VILLDTHVLVWWVNRRPRQRQKDLADIARIREKRPDLSSFVPSDIRNRLY